MATPTIPNGETQFFVSTYEGDGKGQRVGKFVPFTDSGTIANSCIFNSPNSPVLSRTPSVTGTSKKTFTISAWVKRGRLINASSEHSMTIHGVFHGSSGRYGVFGLYNGGSGNPTQLRLLLGKYTSGSSTTTLDWYTNRTLEDTSKWYHLMATVDTTISTADDRVKLYIDGERITSFASSSNPSLNDEFYFGSEYANYVSTYDGSFGDWDGYMAEVNFVDGQALLPASFGLTDTSTGRWIPSVVKPYPTTTTTFTVTVADASGNKYFIDSSQQATVTLIEGATYRFDQSDSSNAGHPLRFSTTSNGTHSSGVEFNSGVTTVGTPGSSGAYTEITVPVGTATLYYYCSVHGLMGGQANTQDAYGTNGFRLKFQDSSALGDDTSGNTNDFTATNLASTDQTTDSPTQNHATLQGTGGTLSEGNLTLVTGNSEFAHHNATLKPKSGKYYAEFTCNAMGRSEVGVASTTKLPYSANNVRLPATDDGSLAGYMWYGYNGQIYTDSGSSNAGTYATYTTNDIISIALDLDNHTVQFFKNNSSVGTFGLPNSNYTFVMGDGATGYSGGWTANFGQKSFTYTPPTGFVALQQDNLPETAKGISGLVWTKNRDASDSHQMYDSSRGKQKLIVPDTNAIQSTVTDGLQKFLAGGQQIEDSDAINTSGESFVSWNWVANGGTTATNNDGSISSVVQANQDAGFSIVQFTGIGSNATVGHGLSSAPEWILVKSLDDVIQWTVQHKVLTATSYLHLNLTNASASTTSVWNDTNPTSTVFSVGTANALNKSGSKFIAYCWHSVDGFSKFGKYTGNGNADGPFVYTGFKPAWVMIKNISGTYHWNLFDSARDTFNPVDRALAPSSTAVETNFSTSEIFDFLSNGFKLRCTLGGENLSGNTYIYMAFAEHPFVGDGTSPVTAR